MTVYSSIYHSLATIELIKELEKKEIPLSTISSHGFGSLVVALYVRDKSIGNVEWSLFKLLKNLKGKVPYSKKWRDVVFDFIDQEFPNQKISDFKPALLIPFLDKDKKVIFKEEGLVKDILKATINIDKRDNFMKKSQVYHYLIGANRIDLNFAIGFLPEMPSFKKINGYTYGIITKHLGMAMNAGEDLTLVRGQSISSVDLLSPISDINQMYRPGILLFIKNIEEKVKNWQEDSSSGFQY